MVGRVTIASSITCSVNPTLMEAYGLCHATASYVYLNDEGAFKGLSAQVIKHLKQVVAAINEQPIPPEGFEGIPI